MRLTVQFAAMEAPDSLITDIRAFFGSLPLTSS